MHRGIVPHRRKLEGSSLALLDHVDFIFLCIDNSPSKGPIIERLERTGKCFIDVGMGLQVTLRGVFG